MSTELATAFWFDFKREDGTTKEIVFGRKGNNWFTSAIALGDALGYSQKGERLLHEIDSPNTNWKEVLASDFLRIDTEAEFFKIGTDSVVRKNKLTFQKDSKGLSVPLLTLHGAIVVAAKSRSKFANDLLNNLVGRIPSMLEKHEVRETKLIPEDPYITRKHKEFLYASMVDVANLLLGAKTIDTKEYKERLEAALRVVGAPTHVAQAQPGEATTLSPTDRTVVLPVGQTAPTGPVTVLPEVVKIGQRPDGLPEQWKTASDIGASLTPPLKSSEVKKFLHTLRDEYRERTGAEYLPNKVVKEVLTTKSVDSLERYNGKYPFLSNGDGSGMAFYSEMEGGQVIWRNYWAPSVATKIASLYRGFLDQQAQKSREKEVKNGTVHAVSASTEPVATV